VRFCRKRIRPELFVPLEQFSATEVERMMILLRLGVILNIKRQSNILPEYTIGVQGSVISLSFAEGWLEQKPIFSADLHQEAQYLKVLGYTLKLS
jgi:exopolyphosphatase/guanosine-5'-triphosphate,3'-diphosphate pyrophosphatase